MVLLLRTFVAAIIEEELGQSNSKYVLQLSFDLQNMLCSPFATTFLPVALATSLVATTADSDLGLFAGTA